MLLLCPPLNAHLDSKEKGGRQSNDLCSTRGDAPLTLWGAVPHTDLREGCSCTLSCGKAPSNSHRFLHLQKLPFCRAASSVTCPPSPHLTSEHPRGGPPSSKVTYLPRITSNQLSSYRTSHCSRCSRRNNKAVVTAAGTYF